VVRLLTGAARLVFPLSATSAKTQARSLFPGIEQSPGSVAPGNPAAPLDEHRVLPSAVAAGDPLPHADDPEPSALVQWTCSASRPSIGRISTPSPAKVWATGVIPHAAPGVGSEWRVAAVPWRRGSGSGTESSLSAAPADA
jgi:hypothetical protein